MANTEAGKAIAARNSVRHGILACKTPVLSQVEQEGDWQEHLEGVFESYSPVGQVETALTERVALCLWRLGRVARYEREQVSSAQETLIDRQAAGILIEAGVDRDFKHPDDAVAVWEERRAAGNALAQLEDTLSQPAETPVQAEDASATLYALAGAIRKPGFDLNRHSLPGVPASVELSDFDGWTVGILQGCIEALAKVGKQSQTALLKAGSATAAASESEAERVAVNVRHAIERRRRTALLPAEESLQRVVRYESHLSRQLYSAMRELEALQSKRRGLPAPLARLEIGGVPQE